TVVIMRDHTELQALTGELTTARSLAEALRSQAHEAANRLHTVVSLVEIGKPEQAVEFATAELALAQELTDRVVGAVAEPVLAALLLGKAAEANERGVELTITPDTMIDDTGLGLAARDLVTILGNLIDNGIEAAVRGDGRPGVVVTARSDVDGLLLRVADTGPGVPEDADVFRRGWSTKAGEGHGLGLALAGQAVRRYGGSIEVGHDGGAVFTVRLPRQEANA
ncbi:MAG TPA: ATP-binding protein, partial [Amycolatopsis sp.]|nr:ATP-binding protein [Amycolatopsis sp.]